MPRSHPLHDIAVVIPTHNRSAKLARTLDHLAANGEAAAWHVLVVANNCDDDTIALCEHRSADFPVPIRVLEEPTPGAAAARNSGAAHAEARDILFLDDDILVGPDCLRRVRQTRAQHPDAWITAQVLSLPEHEATAFGAFRRASMPPAPIDGPVVEVEWFASGMALVPAKALLDLGGYEEAFTTAALEDSDLAIRARRAGNTIVFDPGLVSYHNDWAGASIRDFCLRAYRYCLSAPQLEKRFGPDDHPWSQLIRRNRAVRREDPPALIASKLAKRAAGTDGALRLILSLAELMERTKAPSWMLWRVYRAAVAGSMYAGYQAGLSGGTDPPALGHFSKERAATSRSSLSSRLQSEPRPRPYFEDYTTGVKYHHELGPASMPERLQVVMEALGTPGRLLDVGCHTGFMGVQLVAKGWRVEGIEANADAAAVAEASGMRVVVGSADDRASWDALDPGFDVVLLLDVLEHTYDPWSVVEAAWQHLRPGGRVLVTLPNVASWAVLRPLVLKRQFVPPSTGLDDPTHIRFFTLRDAQAMLKEAGFGPVEVRAAWPCVPAAHRLRRLPPVERVWSAAWTRLVPSYAIAVPLLIAER